MDANTSLRWLRRLYPILVIGLVVIVATPSVADPRDWTNSSGSNPAFGWTNGQSGDGDVATTGLWGDPDVTELGFFFRNMHPMFEATATFPNSAGTLSGLSVVMNTSTATPPAAPLLTELHIREWGTYTGDIEDVEATGGTVLLTSLSPLGPPTNLGELAMSFDPLEGTWSASLDVIFAAIGGGFPTEVNILSVDVTNHLKAIPLDGTASIQKEGAIVSIPEPTTLGLGILGLIPVLLRRVGHGSRQG